MSRYPSIILLSMLHLNISCVAQEKFDDYEDFFVEFNLPFEDYCISKTFNAFAVKNSEEAFKYAKKSLDDDSIENYWAVFSGIYQLYSNSYVSYIYNQDKNDLNLRVKNIFNQALKSKNDRLVTSSLAFLYWHLDLLDVQICKKISFLVDSEKSDISFIANSILAEVFLPPKKYFLNSIRRDGGIGKKEKIPISRIREILNSSGNDKDKFILAARFPRFMEKPSL